MIRGSLDISNPDQLEQLKEQGAVFILFGSEDCGVCHALRPKLVDLLSQSFPQMQRVYIDCQAAPMICAQHQVFSLPVVQAYIEGHKVYEQAKVFGLGQLNDSLSRPYNLWRQSIEQNH